MEKSVAYDPGSRIRMLAWWSPDGTMGRAKGVSALDPAKAAAAKQYATIRSRRARAVAVAGGGLVGSFAAGIGMLNIDSAGFAAHTDRIQSILETMAGFVMVVGPVVAVTLAVWIWRRRPKANIAPSDSSGGASSV
jgi:hypothetical protein